MEDKLRKRINEFMDIEKISVNALSKVIGVQTRTLNNQINSNTAISAVTLLEILFHYPQVSAEWLMRGEGLMKKSVSTDNIDVLQNTIFRQQREIDGLYERIDELKGGDSTAQRVSALAG